MPRKPRLSPAEVKQMERIEREQLRFERCYGRMRRAIAGMESARKTIVRCRRRLARLAEEAQEAQQTTTEA